MQITLDLPEQLARRLEGKKERLAQIIERGLQEYATGASPRWREVIAFLASGPDPKQIAAFQPSEQHVERSRELLEANRDARLTESDEAEMDEIEHINHLMTLLKIEARKMLAEQKQQ